MNQNWNYVRMSNSWYISLSTFFCFYLVGSKDMPIKNICHMHFNLTLMQLHLETFCQVSYIALTVLFCCRASVESSSQAVQITQSVDRVTQEVYQYTRRGCWKRSVTKLFVYCFLVGILLLFVLIWFLFDLTAWNFIFQWQ